LTEYGSVFAFIAIQVSVAVPIEQQAECFAQYPSDVTTQEGKDFEVTYSHSLPGKWDWATGFTYIGVFDEVEGVW
jgi:hypothetical protein